MFGPGKRRFGGARSIDECDSENRKNSIVKDICWVSFRGTTDETSAKALRNQEGRTAIQNPERK